MADGTVDPFAASSSDQSSEYSEDKFYTRSRDTKGFGTTIKVQLPPPVLGAIAELIASRRVPEYRTTADFVRDALVHHLHRRQDQLEQGQFEGVVTAYIALANAQHESDMSKAMQETAALYDQLLASERDLARVNKLLDSARSALPTLSDYYSAELQRTIDRYTPLRGSDG